MHMRHGYYLIWTHCAYSGIIFIFVWIRCRDTGHPVWAGCPLVRVWLEHQVSDVRSRPVVRGLELPLFVLYLASSLARPLDVVALWLSSKYLIMHSTHVGGSNHVSHVESEGSERSDFTLCPMASS